MRSRRAMECDEMEAVAEAIDYRPLNEPFLPLKFAGMFVGAGKCVLTPVFFSVAGETGLSGYI